MIPLFKVRMADDVTAKLDPVLKSGYIGEGPQVKQFESELRDFFRSENIRQYSHDDFVITTNSATSAEHLAFHVLKSLDMIHVGDEVLATPLTCTATNWPILANGLRIKWVDVDPNTLNMDLDDLARKITSKTRAIMLVHWGGYPVDMDRLNLILKDCLGKFGFIPKVIQDCAHALGSTYKGNSLVGLSDFSTYSFQAIKHLTCGDGGALVTLNQSYSTYAKLMRWYGIDRDGPRTDFRCEEDIKYWGYKFHMNDISATIGLANMPGTRDAIFAHKVNAVVYNEVLKDIPGVRLLNSEYDSAYWIYTMRVENRDGFIKKMKEHGIQTSRVHERNDKHSCVREFRAFLPTLDEVVKDMVCIPVGWWVDPEQRQHIIDSIKAGW